MIAGIRVTSFCKLFVLEEKCKEKFLLGQNKLNYFLVRICGYSIVIFGTALVIVFTLASHKLLHASLQGLFKLKFPLEDSCLLLEHLENWIKRWKFLLFNIKTSHSSPRTYSHEHWMCGVLIGNKFCYLSTISKIAALSIFPVVSFEKLN